MSRSHVEHVAAALQPLLRREGFLARRPISRVVAEVIAVGIALMPPARLVRERDRSGTEDSEE
jgi:hypothetical protein